MEEPSTHDDPDLKGELSLHLGTEATRDFYERKGWSEEDGKPVDTVLFGPREDGPIRRSLYQLRIDRTRKSLLGAGEGELDLLEVGCGGNPFTGVLDACSHYTGADFSRAGLRLAAERMSGSTVQHSFDHVDIARLPYEDGTFNAVYSAHVLYHIDDDAGQRAALQEIVRVLHPGGRAVLILANPWPILFPVRAARRAVATIPGLARLANRLRKRPPIPYRPMSLGWTRRQLGRHGEVDIMTYSVPSVSFAQGVS